MKFIASTLASVGIGALGVRAWGASGHQSVGYVAMDFLSNSTLAFVKESLGSTYKESLGIAATWADDIKSNHAYDWAKPLHYVDAEDSPPSACSVDQSRDCADGNCILTAISNYTERVVDTSLSAAERQEALKFITHFIGDIGQPLHVEAEALGGNDIDVTCGGSTTNLHSVWDTKLVEKLISADYDSTVTTFASALVDKIKNGEYAADADAWGSCTTTNGTDCQLQWAEESNKYDCSYVWTYTDFDDICDSDYYTGAVPIIEEQIAKQGYRLAAWLNSLDLSA